MERVGLHIIIKGVMVFGSLGAAISAAVFYLSSFKPTVFGLFTLPFWLLPAISGLGAHDNIFPLGFLGASLFYGILCFAVSRVLCRRSAARTLR